MSRSYKIVLGVLSATVLVLVLLAGFAGSSPYGSDLDTGQDGVSNQDGMMRGYGMMDQDGMMRGYGMMDQGSRIGGGWGIVGVLVPLLFIGGLIGLVVWPVTQTGSGTNAPGRYGSGEVHERSAKATLVEATLREG